MLRACQSRRFLSQPAVAPKFTFEPLQGDPDDYVTRRELNEFGQSLGTAIVTAVKTEITTMKTDMTAETTKIKTDMTAEMTKMKTDMTADFTKQFNTLKTQVGALADGLGIKFEKMSATYIQDIIHARGSKLTGKLRHQ